VLGTTGSKRVTRGDAPLWSACVRRSHLATLLVGVFWAAGPSTSARGDSIKIGGRVTFDGHRLPPGRKVRAVIARDFPGLGGVPDAETTVDAAGRFVFNRPAPGLYWLAAYVDDDADHTFSPGREIMGYATTNPVPIGDGRNQFNATIDLSPIQVTLVTRFQPAQGNASARRVIESLRVVPLNPHTGKFLADAEVIVSNHKLELAPEGNAFLYAPDPPETVQGRYLVEVLHPVFGRSARKHAIAPRAFGAVPEARIEGQKVVWASPPWANVSLLRPVRADGAQMPERPARSPADLVGLGAVTAVRVRVGRVDVQHAGDVTLAVGETTLTTAPDKAQGVHAAPAASASPPPAPAASSPAPEAASTQGREAAREGSALDPPAAPNRPHVVAPRPLSHPPASPPSSY